MMQRRRSSEGVDHTSLSSHGTLGFTNRAMQDNTLLEVQMEGYDSSDLSTGGGGYTQLETNCARKEILAGKQKCIKNILKALKEFNRETSRFWSTVVNLGSMYDVIELREALRIRQVKTLQLAKKNMNILLPHLRGQMHNRDDLAQYEKLWNDYACCLELLQQQLHYALQLQQYFPIYSESAILIRTGLSEVPGVKSKNRSHENCSADLTQDSNNLKRDIVDVAKMLDNVRNMVDIKPWEMEPQMNTAIQGSGKTGSNRVAPARSRSNLISVDGGKLSKKKRIILVVSILVCIILAVVIAVVVIFKRKN